jgi:HD-like signal output (HDOD) protein
MKFDELFSHTESLPTIPKVVHDLMNALHNENVSVSEVARKIELDQVIAAKLLRLANSAYYGVSHRIASVDKAIHMLGFSTMRTLVISVGLSGCFKNIPNVDLPTFWRHSIRVACVARALARPAKVDVNTAFTVGLMYAIGHLLMALGIPEMATLNASHAIHAIDRHAVEEETFGYSFPEVSAELMSRWNFAPEFEATLLNFNAPLDADPFEALAGVLHLAAWRVSFEEQGCNADELFNSWPEDVAGKIGISIADIQAIASPKDLTADLESLLG